MEMKEIDPDRFVYCRRTGNLYRLKPNGLPASGKPAGYKSNGYIKLRYGKARALAHRLVWRIVYGEWPAGQIDHINGDRADNRIENLRLATQAENQQNRRIPGRRNKSGFLGVSWDRVVGMWHAQIAKDGICYPIGWFETPEEAHAAYLKAKMKLHPFYAAGIESEAAHGGTIMGRAGPKSRVAMARPN